MIIFEKVTKRFPLGNLGVSDVSFRIETNEFVFLVGSSGAGKTTIIKLINREILPSSGSIIIDNEEISSSSYNRTTQLRRKIGIVFQDFKLLYEKNVFENVSLPCQIKNLSWSETKEKVNQALALVGLLEKKDFFPIQLSIGEIQRVAIARAIVDNRDYLIADEPTGNLDPKTAWGIMKIFKKFEGKKTIIVSTHNNDIVNSFQKRVIVLKNARIIKDKRKGTYEI
ncbi:MAG: ATP-binding cassette domain-containing protein [Patescibacteria group bacterium]|nr:ATP-binding cassette domain-containing protein [Patescibacteria group bacterium]